MLLLLLLAVLAFAPPLFAQETPTEREAARDVVQKLDSLERSLGIPALVVRLTGPDAARDKVVARAKELMDTELLALGDDITRHPEIGFQETRSVDLLTKWLEKHDFVVERGVAGLPTAFVARSKHNNGAPRLGVILEYDALRGTKGPFHAGGSDWARGWPESVRVRWRRPCHVFRSFWIVSAVCRG